MKGHTKRYLIVPLVLIAVIALFANSCSSDGGSAADDIASERGLSDDDVTAAVSTYTPSGTFDEYIMFASGGHGGQVFMIGMPSMRLLRTIGVFTPEPWQGWGYGDDKTMEVLAQGDIEGSSSSSTTRRTHVSRPSTCGTSRPSRSSRTPSRSTTTVAPS